MGAGAGTVLLVEDHDELRARLCSLLESAGYAVVAACDGITALGVVAAWPIDLLVTDVSMPRLGGAELARRVAASRPDLKVLLMSTSRLSDEEVAEVYPGPARFLAKPFTADELKRAVSEMLAAGRADADPQTGPV